jgi:hypothetical protein
MKHFLVRLISLMSILVVSTVATHNYTHRQSPPVINEVRVDTLPLFWKTTINYFPNETKSIVSTRTKLRGGIKSFLVHMGRIEGLGSYETVSSRGYLGLYQFHPKTLRGMGVNVSKSEFLQNAQLQDSVMIEWLRGNARSLRGLIKKYHGTEYDGVYVTKSGILAGAHLIGPGGMLAFFYPEKYDFRTTDGNGVHVSEYMKKFAHYDLRGL